MKERSWGGHGRWMNGHAEIYLSSDKPKMKSLHPELFTTNIDVAKLLAVTISRNTSHQYG
jgi:hypothetical protein